MPAVSEAQRRFFRFAEAHPKAAGVRKSVSHEYNQADPGGKLPERASDSEKAKRRYGGKK